MDDFTKEKKDFLNKKDKSKKGSIDKDIVGLIKLINSKENYCTTSSCGGRIVLLEKYSRKKNETYWLLSKHSTVKTNEIIKTLNINENNSIIENKNSIINDKNIKILKNDPNNEIWFKQEPLILHIRCKDFNSARKLLIIARKMYKRAGIISYTDKKIIVEINGSERVDTLIKKKGIMPDKDYINELVKCANSNFVENKKKIMKFESIIKKFI
jgi:tRNA wybutosine-synthesizing protein 3